MMKRNTNTGAAVARKFTPVTNTGLYAESVQEEAMTGYNERNREKMEIRKAKQEAVRAARREGRRIARELHAEEVQAELTFDNLFKMPVSADGYGLYIFDAENQMMLQSIDDCFLDTDATGPERFDLQIGMTVMMETALNGTDIPSQNADLRTSRYLKLKQLVLDKLELPLKTTEECITDSTGRELFLVRAWGYLTGTMKMNSDRAVKIQDEILGRFCTAFNNRFYKE